MKKLKFKKFLIILAGTIAVGCIFPFVYREFLSNKPNIILIVIDALRPDHLSCYGYERNTSPNIDKLAKEGVMFTQAITAGGWTAESVPSTLTGTYSFIHQVRYWNSPRNFTIRTLPQLLNSKSLNSALFTNHHPISMIDIKDGFDLIYIADHSETDDHQLTLKVINWLKENKDKPFFVYLHYKGPHVPYRPPEPYKSKYFYDRFNIKKEIPISKDKSYSNWEKGKIPHIVVESNISDVSYYTAQYDGAISYTDDQVGRLIDSLKKFDLLENTLIILIADQGEMLGEHDI